MEALSVLGRLHGRLSLPVAAFVSRWLRDPFSRGSYSYLPPGATGRDLDLIAAPVSGRLLFAGEHTIRPFPSTAHGEISALCCCCSSSYFCCCFACCYFSCLLPSPLLFFLLPLQLLLRRRLEGLMLLGQLLLGWQLLLPTRAARYLLLHQGYKQQQQRVMLTCATVTAAAGACISGSREAQRIVDWVAGSIPKKKLQKVPIPYVLNPKSFTGS